MRHWVVYIVCVLAFIGCREYQVSDDPSLRLAFSADTICFDTLFTEQGSATAQLVVYNPNKNALVVDKIWMEDGEAFRANIDGEPALERERLSLCVFALQKACQHAHDHEIAEDKDSLQ